MKQILCIFIFTGSLLYGYSEMRVIRTAPNDALNLRSGPSVKSKVVGKIPFNARKIVYKGSRADKNGTIITKDNIDDPKYQNSQVAWLFVQYQSLTGWAHSNFLYVDIDLPKIKDRHKNTGLYYGLEYFFDSDTPQPKKGRIENSDWTLVFEKDGTGTLSEVESTVSFEWKFTNTTKDKSVILVHKHTKKVDPDGTATDGYPKNVSLKYDIRKSGHALVESASDGERIYEIKPFEISAK